MSVMGRFGTVLLLGAVAAVVPYAADFSGYDNERLDKVIEQKLTGDENTAPDSSDIRPDPQLANNVDPGRSDPPTEHEGRVLQCGKASYYADTLAGNPTSSGEIYDPRKYTAAHRALAFGTEVRVVRTDTGASVSVIINDRGPYAPDKIIDLSRSAAEDIGLIRAGVTEVCLYETH